MNNLDLKKLIVLNKKIKAQFQAKLRTNIQIIEMVIDLIVEDQQLPNKEEILALKKALGNLKYYVNEIY